MFREIRVVKFLADRGFGFAKERTMGGRIVFFHIDNGVILKPSLTSSKPQFSSEKSNTIPRKDDILIAEVYIGKKGPVAKKWGFSQQYAEAEGKLPEFRLMVLSDGAIVQKQWWKNVGCLNDSLNEIFSAIKGKDKFWFETRLPVHDANDWESDWEKCKDPRM